MILVMNSGALSRDSAFLKLFQSWGESKGEDDVFWVFFKVILCRLDGHTAILPGTFGIFLSGDLNFPVGCVGHHPAFLTPVFTTRLGTEELLREA